MRLRFGGVVNESIDGCVEAAIDGSTEMVGDGTGACVEEGHHVPAIMSSDHNCRGSVQRAGVPSINVLIVTNAIHPAQRIKESWIGVLISFYLGWWLEHQFDRVGR